jgi:hypothetical protein
MGKNNHRKERRIKIVDPKKINYTRAKMNYLSPDPLYTAMKRIFTLHRDQKPKKRALIEYGKVLRRIQRHVLRGG